MNFCKVFQECLENVNMRTYIINGFRKCGLFPMNSDNVDYTKCIKNTLEKQIMQASENESERISSAGIKSARIVRSFGF